MTFNAAKPRYSLPFGDKQYDIVGDFALIEAIEYAMQDSIVNLMVSCLDMPVSKMAKLIHTVVKSTGESLTQTKINDTLWNEIGISTTEYQILCLHLHTLLKIIVAKPAERSEVANKMGELMGELNLIEASPGKTTSASV